MTRWLCWIALASSFTACGGGSPPVQVSSSPRPGRYGAGGYATPSVSSPYKGAFPSAPGAAPEVSRGQAYADESAAAERPGLGTEWGETRYSHVSNTAFDRSDPSQPFALVTLRYNDRAGIQGALARLGSVSSVGLGAQAGGGGLTVRLLDEWGNPLRSYGAGNQCYVEGSPGQRYVIEVQNRTGQRFEVVASVDGLDVLDGSAGTFEKRGYVMRPFSTLEIEGFRQSLDEVAAFRFGRVADSYAARTGDDRNVGVVGVAFFGEAGAPPPYLDSEQQRRDRAEPFPGRFAQPPRW
ncbi:MAG TPA: hypothetical protein VFQ61_38425 [Polyangiaceae bacterium]|nr:hypothetical protein [Polyangiaceae bacterium]